MRRVWQLGASGTRGFRPRGAGFRHKGGGGASGGGGSFGGTGGSGGESGSGFGALVGLGYTTLAFGHAMVTGRWPGDMVVDREAWELEQKQFVGPMGPGRLPKSGMAWFGSYDEEGHTGLSEYYLEFEEDGRVAGRGKDCDGGFVVSGWFNPRNRKVAWYERGAVHTIVTGTLDKNLGQFNGWYQCKNTNVVGGLAITQTECASEVDSTSYQFGTSLDGDRQGVARSGLGKNLMLRQHRGLLDQVQVLVFFPFQMAKVHYNRYVAAESFKLSEDGEIVSSSRVSAWHGIPSKPAPPDQ